MFDNCFKFVHDNPDDTKHLVVIVIEVMLASKQLFGALF